MKIKRYLPIIGILIFLYIIFKLDISNILDEVYNANINWLLVATFFLLISLITQTLKWFVIAKVQLMKISFLEAFKINLISWFYGSITPSRIGVAIRAEYLKKYNNSSLGKGLSNYTLDKVFDLFSLVFLVVIFSFVFRDIIPGTYFQYSIIALAFLLISLIIFRDKKRSKAILGGIYRNLIPEKIKEKVKPVFHSFYQDMPKKRYFILFLLLNIVNWVVLYAITFSIGVSLGVNISFMYYLAILPIATLISLIPITIGGLGTREAAMIYLFNLFGVEAAKVFSMSLIGLVLGILPALIGSFLIFKKR